MKSHFLFKSLQQHIQTLGLEVSEDTISRMIEFLLLLKKWNNAFNLTAITDLQEMMIKHLLDSLSIFSYLKGPRLIDVGTGAGLPGIPLALVMPHCEFTLVESRGKKVSFLQQAKSELKISNIKIEQKRVEQFHDAQGFDIILCRAVGTIPEVYLSTLHLAHQRTQWVFMKGLEPKEELSSFSQPVKVYPLCVPGLQEARHVVVIQGSING